LGAPSSGALVWYRRRTRTLADQLAQRMTVRGQAVDIPALEAGHPAPADRVFREALAGALEWRVGILRMAGDLPVVDQDASFADKIIYLRAIDEAAMIRAELADLQELHQVLRQWTNDLTHRVSDLQSGTRADMTTPPFDA